MLTAIPDVGQHDLITAVAHLFALAQLAGQREPGGEVRPHDLPYHEFLYSGYGVADVVDVSRALVDPADRIHRRTGQWTSEILTGEVPVMRSGTSPYRLLGDGLGWLCLGLVAVAWASSAGPRRAGALFTTTSGPPRARCQ